MKTKRFQILTSSGRLGFRFMFLLALTATPVLFFSACSSQQTGTETADLLFSEAEELLKDQKYLQAIEKFRDLKNRYPYSNRAIDAELRIADAFFEQESFFEAASSYETFRELHPTHPKADYVQFRIGLSYYNQVPENTSQDLAPAYRAIDSFNQFLSKYPNSEYAAKAREYVHDSRSKLAENENRIGDFYFDRQHYLSASTRYKDLLEKYPNLGFDERALFNLGKCYLNIRMFPEARSTFEKLTRQYPNSTFQSSAKSFLEELSKKN